MDSADRRTAELAALETYRREAARAPRDADAQLRLGVFAFQLAQSLLAESDAALRNAESALTAAGRTDEAERAHAIAVLALLAAGDFEAAKRHLDGASESAAILAVRAEIEFHGGRSAEGRALLARAEKDDAANPIVKLVRARRANEQA